MSLYEHIPMLPPDPIFGISSAYNADPRPDKLTLVTGYFRDRDLKVPVLKSVAEIEKKIASEKRPCHYLPIDGDSEFIKLLGELVFGDLYDEEILCGFQTVGGTGALCLCGHLIDQFLDQISISNHTWANHWNIFRGTGLQTLSYPYYREKELVFDEMLAELKGYPETVAVLLHANGHNPTGLDLSHEQWKELAAVVKEKRLYPVIDMAYQGFSKEPHEDAFGPRLFLEEGIEFALTYTCSKNFSIYGQRAGALYFVVRDPKFRENVRSQIKVLVRQMYSEPPVFAAEIVKGILKDPKLKLLWLEELSEMRDRMYQAREDFISLISKKDPEGNWERLRVGSGLFCVTELGEKGIERLRDEKGIYATVGGRVNLTGLNMANLERVIEAILDIQ